MVRRQLADGKDSLQICRVARILGNVTKPSVLCKGRGISEIANKQSCFHDVAVQRKIAKSL
jgi:hypothetical protein